VGRYAVPMGVASDRLAPREAAVAVVRRLREHGFTAYLAGGCVRDELLGQVPKDFDVATDGAPDHIRVMFKRTAAVGAAFGVMLVREFGPTIEVATFRADGPYTDKRRPDSVRFSDARADAQRRDFTVNALFIDPLAEGDARVIDFVDGRRDLAERTLRAVGDPDRRLAEDHLRALRGVRFAARYGLAIEAGTAGAIRRHAARLEGVSRERIGEEIRRMFTHDSRGRAAGLLEELGLAAAVLGGSGVAGRGDDGSAMERLSPDASYAAALMVWLMGRGQWRADAPEPGLVGAVRAALLLSNDERDALRDGLHVLAVLMRGWDGLGEAGRKRLASGPGFGDALAVLLATDRDRAAAVFAEVERLRGRFGGLAPQPFVDGEALIGLGLTPGPRFAEILRVVYDAQLEGRVTDTAGARALAGSLAGG
jgi:poly(A) polymerase